MSVSAIVFLLIYTTGLILTFRNPYFGVLTYIFEWHNHPPYFWWGDEVPDLRWSFTIALVTLISWAINRHKLGDQDNPDYRPAIWVALMLLNMYFVSSLHAVLPEDSYAKATDMFNILVNFVLMVSIMRKHEDYRKLIWVMIICVGYWGWIAYTQGSNRDIGVLAPNATEENAVSAHVMTVLPFVGVYFLTGNRLGKIITALMLPFAFNLIILANSRATFVGLLVIAAISIFLVKGKTRYVVIAGIIAAGFVFMQLTNEDFTDRQTMQTYDDGSATSRLHIWAGGYEMWKDHPYGVGGGGFAELSTDYIPEIDESKSQHNTFVAVFTDWGFIGIILYLGFLIHIFILSMKAKHLSRKFPSLNKYTLEITAVQLALVGICTAGFFHSRQYAEIVFWLCAFVMMLNNMVKTDLAKLQKESMAIIPVPVEEDVPAIQNTLVK